MALSNVPARIYRVSKVGDGAYHSVRQWSMDHHSDMYGEAGLRVSFRRATQR